MMKNERERECTFQPERKERSDEPSMDEFLRKEQEHLKRKDQFCADKLKEKGDAELSKLQNKPSINDSSRVLAMNLPSTQERLLSKKAALGTPSPAREKAEQRAGMRENQPVIL